MDPLLCVDTLCEVHAVILFFTAQNESAIEIHREVCSVYGMNIYTNAAMVWTRSLWISTADLFWAVKRQITACTWQGATIRNGSCIYCILYVFVKWLLLNFYSVSRNSKIISPCNFTLIGSQNTEKIIWRFTFETILIIF